VRPLNGVRRCIVVGCMAVCLAAVAAEAGTLKCPPDSVKVGNTWIDTYEASVWQIPPSNISLVRRVQAGKATLTNLTAGGAVQLAPAGLCALGLYGIRGGDWAIARPPGSSRCLPPSIRRASSFPTGSAVRAESFLGAGPLAFDLRLASDALAELRDPR